MINFNTTGRLLALLMAVMCSTSCTNNPGRTIDSVMTQIEGSSGMGCTLESNISSNITHTVVRDLQSAKETFARSPTDCRVMKDGLMVQQAPIAALNFVSNGKPLAVLEIVELFGRTNVQLATWSPTTNWFVSTDRHLISELMKVKPIHLNP